MKAPDYAYRKPRTLAETFALMAEYGDEARLLAGGQTLLATLNMRLSEPALLIDIGALDALRGIALDGGVLRIGALTTHSEIEASALVARHAPLLAEAAPHIAHRAIRNVGTWGGSLAYADPAAEWPACALALDATMVVAGAQGERRIAARDFFVDLYTTALGPGELLAAAEIPVAGDTQICAFGELARRHGDYAIVGLAASARRAASGLDAVRLAWMGLAATPLRTPAAEAALAAQGIDAAVAALLAEIDPLPDLTHSPATKRHLAGVLLRRVATRLTETRR